MVTIHKERKDNFTLNHYRYCDAFGFVRDSFELTFLRPNGELVLCPFIPGFKVKIRHLNMDFLDTTTDYSPREYTEMLDDLIKIQQ